MHLNTAKTGANTPARPDKIVSAAEAEQAQVVAETMESEDARKRAERKERKAAAKAELKKLAESIRAADAAYYQDDAPTLTDADYDKLRHVLDTARALQARQAVVITGHGAMEVEAACAMDTGARGQKDAEARRRIGLCIYISWEFAVLLWADWPPWRARRATALPAAMRGSTRP